MNPGPESTPVQVPLSMRLEVRRPLQRPYSVLMGAGILGALLGKQESFPELFPARVGTLGHLVPLGPVFSECG